MCTSKFLKPGPDHLFAISLSLPANAQQGLRVSANKRFLVKEDGSPFFYLADTGWELIHRLTKNEAYTYLSNRASKGFTVIQCVLLGEINGLTEPNAAGDLALTDMDPSKPNEAYFKHVDAIVDLATDMGLYLALLPTWGSWVMKENHPLFPSHQIFTKENARVYGRFVGNRYKAKKNIIWVLGGDRNPTGYEAVWEAMAAGLKEGDGGSHLMTYHPTGNWSSSVYWQKAPWLDFNMLQSGHATRFVNSYDFIRHDYNQLPVKPTFDAETNYETCRWAFITATGSLPILTCGRPPTSVCLPAALVSLTVATISGRCTTAKTRS
jgi:hypothetical protein